MALSFEESKKRLTQLSASPTIISLYNADEPSSENGESEWVLDDGYTQFNNYFDDKFSYIDENKNITIDTSQINISREVNSQFIPFEMMRYYDGIDLAEMAISIHYTRYDNTHNWCKPVNVMHSAEKIRFAWLVDGNVTSVVGKLKFEIHADGKIYDVAGKDYPYRWKSRSTDRLNVVESLCHVSDCKQDDPIINDEQVQDAITSAAQDAVNDILLNGNYATKTYVDEEIDDVEDKIPNVDELSVGWSKWG